MTARAKIVCNYLCVNSRKCNHPASATMLGRKACIFLGDLRATGCRHQYPRPQATVEVRPAPRIVATRPGTAIPL